MGKEVQACNLGGLKLCHFFLMSQNSIFLAQMGNNIVGEGVESVFWANIVKFGGRSIMV
jgi:hypothetical protein